MSEVINIEYFVTNNQQGEYINVPFSLDSNVDSITINYEYVKDSVEIRSDNIIKKNHSIIDFSITAPLGQYLGSSGSNRKKFTFSCNEAPVGFSKPHQMSGEWCILLGAYKVPEEGVKVTYTITINYKKRRLLKGDTHSHSTGSDGNLSLDLLVESAKNLNLDYLILTDHNNFYEHTSIYSNDHFTLIPGVEWTQYNGHGNFWGVEKPFKENFVTTSQREVQEYIKDGKEQGAKFVLNHPFCCDCPWLWSMEVPYDAVEIWNGGTSPEANMAAMTWWHEQLMEGNKVVVIGGSDFHGFNLFRMLACPTTFVYAWSRSQEDIIESLINGHSFITYTTNGPKIDFEQSTVVCGETYQKGHFTLVVFNNLNSGQIIKAISDVNTLEFLVEDHEIVKKIYIESNNCRFIRFEIYEAGSISEQYNFSFPLLISNAVYFEKS